MYNWNINFYHNLWKRFCFNSETQTFQGRGGAYVDQIEIITASGVRCGPYGGGGKKIDNLVKVS